MRQQRSRNLSASNNLTVSWQYIPALLGTGRYRRHWPVQRQRVLMLTHVSENVGEGGAPRGQDRKERAHCTVSVICIMRNYFRLVADASQHRIHIKT